MRDEELRLIIAEKLADKQKAQKLLDDIAEDSRINLRARHISDDKMNSSSTWSVTAWGLRPREAVGGTKRNLQTEAGEEWNPKAGSAREFDRSRILGCFPENDKFGLGGRHSLRLEQQVAEILVTASAT